MVSIKIKKKKTKKDIKFNKENQHKIALDDFDV